MLILSASQICQHCLVGFRDELLPYQFVWLIDPAKGLQLTLGCRHLLSHIEITEEPDPVETIGLVALLSLDHSFVAEVKRISHRLTERSQRATLRSLPDPMVLRGVVIGRGRSCH